MSDLSGSEILTNWLLSAGLGGLLWGLGFSRGAQSTHALKTLPQWLLILCGITRSREIDHHRFGVQIYAVFMIVWATIVMCIPVLRMERSRVLPLGYALGLFIVALVVLPLADRKNQ